MIEGPAVQCSELPILVAVAAADLRHRADAADCRDAVTDRATVPVECRAEAVLGGFDCGEVLEAKPEQLMLRRCDPRQGTSRQHGPGTRLAEAQSDKTDHYRSSGPSHLHYILT